MCVCCCLFRIIDKALAPQPYGDTDNYYVSSSFLSPNLSILIASSEPQNPHEMFCRWRNNCLQRELKVTALGQGGRD